MNKLFSVFADVSMKKRPFSFAYAQASCIVYSSTTFVVEGSNCSGHLRIKNGGGCKSYGSSGLC
ncbi:hypothetical protein M8C21_026315 [Ambrosia artemisiifolia]|uniref:Uncharacterized protein n=1 Tax=Ambrosia artemisiifolia TaxID=4212 RepID=A0AAD5CXP6_AMBAR|nr:hypothetical protein M8C21_026315 [Ambrosia artemisiifolia]